MNPPGEHWAGLFPDEDYRFHFGLKQGDPAAFFAPTADRARLLAERRHWLATDTARCAALLPAGAPLLAETLALARQWNTLPPSAGDADFNSPFASCLALGCVWEPDFLLLQPESGGEMRLLGGCVCFPSSWRFEEKVGRALPAIHEPVPGLNVAIGSPIKNFLARMRPGVAWCRANWGLSRVADLNQHPAREVPRLRPPLTAEEVWLRIENQALVALPESNGILFGIRLEILALAEIRRHPETARNLQRALRTMPAAVADYKGLTPARDNLISLLEPA